MKRALLSVYDKTGLIEFANGLVSMGYEIISTGGTFELLTRNQLPVVPVEQITGTKELLNGRVKTLHPSIHGGILYKRNKKEHIQDLINNQIQSIDLVCVNLYPFKETLIQEKSLDEILEQIDIGGNTMIRAAAKNYQDVVVVTDPIDYQVVLEHLNENQNLEAFKLKLAAKAFRLSASTDALIAEYYTNLTNEQFPERLTMTYELSQGLRYGENPHQRAAAYKHPIISGPSILNANILHGKTLSYNNIQDANAALEIVLEFNTPVVIVLKHTNPCGIGMGDNLYEAWKKAFLADPISIFGGIVATNQVVDEKTAEELSKIFLEVIIATGFTEDALNILTKKANLRLIQISEYLTIQSKMQTKSVIGGVLVQNPDLSSVTEQDLVVKTKRQPTADEIKQLLFAYKAVKHVKSNAIVIANDFMTLGIGAGQMNRVGAAEIALKQAGQKCVGAVMASDAFFPMKDTVELAAKAGITAIIQPGGSIRDQELIDVCDANNISMVFTGVRHFKH